MGFWPKSSLVVITSAVGVAGMLVCVDLTQSYGAMLFVGVPILMGIVCAALCARLGIEKHRPVLLLTSCSLVGCALLLISGRLEGVICLMMALPLALPIALLAAWVTTMLIHAGRPSTSLTALLLMPLLFGGTSDAELHRVETHIEVAAPPEVVWRNVVEFPALPEPEQLIFKAGLAYPKRARIGGMGVGAIRYCEFSTGSFVEPIQVWDEPHRLAFSVSRNPEPMIELTPYRSLHTPHLNGYFTSRKGEFLLTPLRNGHTLLTGTTWYEIRMGPSVYWRLWSDHIVHEIHLRVLEHIRAESEGEGERR